MNGLIRDVKVLPGSEEEELFFTSGAATVAGVDEVGRGAWAGPISVGVAVMRQTTLEHLPSGVADSKLLSWRAREALFEPLSKAVAAYAIGHASPQECDELGMTRAQRLAAARAFDQIRLEVDAVIVDGQRDFTDHRNARVIIGADRSSIAVAAASVLAKVTRDRLMIDLAPRYAEYAFHRNKGYPSHEHRAALARSGLTDLHRVSWAFAPRYAWVAAPLGAGVEE